MRVKRQLAFAWGSLALGGVAVAQACTSHVPEYALVDGGEEGGEAMAAESGPSPDAVTDASDASDAAAETAPAPETHIRLALWSPDAPGADFCVAPRAGGPREAGSEEGADSGDVWQGPLIGQEATLVDGGINDVFESGTLSGLNFPQASAYFSLPAGAYVVRLVAAGAADCSLPLIGNDATNLAAFEANAFSTVAVIGEYSQSATDPVISIVSFTDDRSSTGGDIALRFIAAVPSLASMDLGEGTLGSPGFRELFSAVAFGASGDAKGSDAGKVDSHGYLAYAPLVDATLTGFNAAGSDGGAPAIVVSGVTLKAGSVATLVAVGGKTGGTPPPPEFALCLDTGPAVDYVFSNCTVLVTPTD